MRRRSNTVCRIVLACACAGAAILPTSASAAPSRPGLKQILFMGTRGGNADLYIVSSQTDRARKVVSNPGHDCGPAAVEDPVGEVVFSSMRTQPGIDPSGHFQLYKLDVRTKKLRQLTNTPGQHSMGPTWSPDGKRIAFSSTRNGSVGTPNWPIADGTIWMMDADGSRVRQVTSVDDAHTHSFPAWSPDGKWIAFMSTSRVDPTRPSVFVVRPDGTDMHIVQYDALYPSWSPDSRSIAFSSGRAGLPNEQDLYVVRADGSDVQRLTKLAGAEYMPSWSRDGKHLVYVHDPDGWTDIAAVLLLPTGQTRDVYSSGPEPSSIWEADLGRTRSGYTVVSRRRRTEGGNDLFPRYAPSWLH